MASPLPTDPYKVLNVPKDATLTTIRSVYRKLVLTCHPDKVFDESIKAQKAEQFHQVQQAYEILSDETRRARYDERVKLAELRAELMAQTGGRTKVTHDYSFIPRPSPTSPYETRGNVVYETREPRPRSYENDYRSPQHDDHRSRTYEDRYDPPPVRRSSGRVSEDRRFNRDYEEKEKERRASEMFKTLRRSQQSESKRTREQSRKQDYDTKYRKAYVESPPESDSDSTETYVIPKRAPEPRRNHDDYRRERTHVPRDRTERRKYTSDSRSSSSDDYESRTHSKVQQAAEHMRKSGGPPVGFVDERRRPSLPRVHTARVAQVPPPPPPPPQPPVDTPRRSSARTRGSRDDSRTRLSTKEKRTPEIVEARDPRRDYENVRRPATLSSSVSAPANIKIPLSSRNATPPRSHTMEVRPSEPKQGVLRRAQTSGPMMSSPSPRSDAAPSKPSKLRNAVHDDSGYSSQGTPELRPGASPQYTTTSKKYQYIEEEEEEEDRPRSARVVEIDSDDYRHEREVSPRSHHHRPERPSPTMRGSMRERPPPSRSATYVQESGSTRPPVGVRSSSGRSGALLYKEFLAEAPSPHQPKDSNINYAPKYTQEDVIYGRHSSESARDAYAYERTSRGSHPGLGKREVSYSVQQDVH